MKKVNIFKLEDRVLFDAAGVADAVDAANQAASAEASAAQEQAQDSKEALKNAPPENPADAAANAQAQQNHSNPGEAADLDAAANKIVEGEIVPGQAPEQADAPADGADVDASAADTDGEAPDADHAAAESQGGDAGDSGDAGDAGDINDVPLGDIDDFINGGHDSDADHDGDAEHNAEQDSADADKPAPALDGVPAAASADAPGRELVIINSSVKDAQSIIDALGDNTDVLFLEKGTDALDAINEYLDANGIKYDAIHIVSHGNAGYFVLNGEIIDAQSVANDPASWANIGKHLTNDGDIMIYGCNVAGNLDGQMLISQIASLTGADVAASVDNTGVNGNWDLEYSIGVIDTDTLGVYDYHYNLTNWNVTVEKGDVSKEGSLAWALNAAYSGDEIIFSVNAETSGDLSDYTINKEITFSKNAESEVDGNVTVTIKDGKWDFSNGRLNIDNGITLVINSGAKFSGYLDNSGRVELSGEFLSGSTIDNYGTFNTTNANAKIDADFSNYGTVNASSGVWGDIENNGTFNLTSGNVRWTSFENASILNINTSYFLSSSSNFTNTGDLVIGTNGALSLASSMVLGGNVSVNAGGYLYVGSFSDVTIDELVNNGTVSVSSGSLTVVERLTNTSRIEVQESGVLTLADGISGRIGGTVYVHGGVLTHSDNVSFNNLERWYKVDSDTTLSDFIVANGLNKDDNLNFYLTNGADFTLDVMYEGTSYSYEVNSGTNLIVATASVVGSLDLSGGTITVNSGTGLEITGKTSSSGGGSMLANAAVVYRQSGVVFGGTYNSDLSLLGESMSINTDLTVAGVLTAKSTTGRVAVTISRDAKLTILGTVADAYTTTYQVYGNMNIATEAAKVAFSGAIYIRTYGQLNAAADYLSFNGYVGIYAGYGIVNITGKYTEFTAGFSDAAGWYNYSEYITDKDANGLHNSIYQDTDEIADYHGTVTIDTTGEVVFSGSHEVVVVNEFNIVNAAKVTFNATLAVAAGNFTASGNVNELYFNDVYVSTPTPRWSTPMRRTRRCAS